MEEVVEKRIKVQFKHNSGLISEYWEDLAKIFQDRGIGRIIGTVKVEEKN